MTLAPVPITIDVDETRQYVGREECEEIIELVESGYHVSMIAHALGRHESTIRRHVRGDCDHHQGYHASKPDLARYIRRLANDMGVIPSTCDWNGWAGAPCSHSYVIDRFGDWPSALEAAGYPGLAPYTTETIRRAVYRKPSIADVIIR